MKEWNWDKNILNPEELSCSSKKKVWWRCLKSHEWQASILSRYYNNHQCPYCSKHQSAVTKEESFGGLYPELLKEWDYKKNTDIDPFKIRKGTKRKAWWICPKGHEYSAAIYHRSNGSNCPICYRENQTSFPEQAIFYYIKKLFTDSQNRHMIDSVEIDIFIPSLNVGIEYDGMYFHKGKKSEEKEQRKQKFLNEKNIKLIRIKESDKINVVDNNIIYYCYSNHHTNLNFAIENLIHLINVEFGFNKKVLVDLVKDRTEILESYMQNEKENSIKTKYPEIAKEWNYEKNGLLKPEYFKYSSNKKVWWSCSKGHEWQMSPNSRVFGQNCPYCSSRKILKGFNDFGSLYPEIAREWHPTKNEKLTPFDVMPYSSKKVWWYRNECGHEWYTAIGTRVHDNSGCPYCSNQKILIGFNDLKTLCPDIAREWNFEKNGTIKPEQFSKGSDKVVWWKCSKGHEWKCDIKSRTIRNQKCPYCSGARVTSGKNDLATNFPQLLKEWNWDKNKILPTEIKGGYSKKVWWICSKGHEWQMTPDARTHQMQNCPYCSGKRVLKGYNDLTTTHPVLIKEWNFEKNKILPETISKGSIKKVWWKCSKGHEWQMTPNARTHQMQNCPYCSNRKILIGYNDFESNYPDLMQEWDYQKNSSISPSEVTKHSNQKIWWICKEHNISYKASIYNRTKGTGCPICSEQKRISNARKNIATNRGSLKENNKILMEEWNWQKNTSINPNEISTHSALKVWWVCKSCGHEWEAQISNRSNGAGCPECSKEKKLQSFRKSILKKGSSLSEKAPHLLKEWNFNRNNTISPDSISHGSKIIVWWKCSKGHEWEATINSRVNGQNCPYCSGRRILSGYNDFKSNYPKLMQEWDYEKNKNINPSEIAKHSNQKVWWKCSKGHEWEAKIYNRAHGTNCPFCYKEKNNNKTMI